MGKLKFALQLYTVRDCLDKDVPGTLDKVKKMGYHNVECSSTHKLTHEEFQKELEQAGLKACSIHVSYDDVTKNVNKAIDLAKLYKVKYVAIGGIDSSLTPDRDGWIACGKALDAGGAILRQAGVQLCYHNHAHEFSLLGGQYAYDLLFGAASPENLAAEIDVFWVRYAGINPVTIINRYAGRSPLIHVKDMANAKSRAFAAVGSGILPWHEIFPAGIKAGADWYIVEQDTCPRDSLESAAESAEFMSKQ